MGPVLTDTREHGSLGRAKPRPRTVIRGSCGCATRKHKTRGQGLFVSFSRNPCLGGRGQDCHWLAEWTIVVGFFLLQRQCENSFLGTKQGWGDCSWWVTPTVIDFVPWV